MTETRLRYALRNLRHLYEQMISGKVKDTTTAAIGLLGPAITMVESEADSQDQKQETSHADA